MDEGVDISYTKFHEQIDNSPYDLVQPGENQLYVGWTEPGEWFNLTVQVAHPAVYSVDLLYTSNRGGTISMDVNGKDATGPLSIASTFNASDPIAWRQCIIGTSCQALCGFDFPREEVSSRSTFLPKET